MPVCSQLPSSCQLGQNVKFPTGLITADATKHFRFQNKKTSIDPGIIAIRFFLKLENRVTLQMDRAIAAWGLNRSQRGLSTLLPVMSD